MDLHDLTLGQSAYINSYLRPGYVKLHDIIPAGSKPSPRDVELWYGLKKGDKLWDHVCKPTGEHRFIFRREDTGGFVIIPGNCGKILSRFRGEREEVKR